MDREIIKMALELLEQKIPCALATIISVRGSTPREVGTQMLISADGSLKGTIGGGCAEAAVRQEALKVIQEGKPEVFHLDLKADVAADEGMVCGGVMDILIEPLGR